MRREVQDQEGEFAFYNATGSLLMKIRKSFGFTENNEKKTRAECSGQLFFNSFYVSQIPFDIWNDRRQAVWQSP